MSHSFASKQKSKPGVPANARSTPLPSAPAHGMSNQRLLQRKSAGGGTGSKFEAERNATLRRRAAVQDEPATVPPIVHEVLASPGQPLDAGTRADMEPRFGHSFGDVRVHADSKAAESARAVNAHAYTVGRDVVFGTGQYQRETVAGKRLLAHELTHIVQQANGYQTKLAINQPGDQYEQEADRAALAVSQGEPSPVYGQTGAGVMRQLMKQQAAKSQADEGASGAQPTIYGPYLLPEVVITAPKPTTMVAVSDVTFVKVQTGEELLLRMKILNQQADQILRFPVPTTNPDVLTSPELELKAKLDHDRKAQEILKERFGEYFGIFFWWTRGGGQTGEGSPLWDILPAGAVFNRAYPPQAYPTQRRIYPDTRGIATPTESTK